MLTTTETPVIIAWQPTTFLQQLSEMPSPPMAALRRTRTTNSCHMLTWFAQIQKQPANVRQSTTNVIPEGRSQQELCFFAGA
jgi:hypothetical protein